MSERYLYRSLSSPTSIRLLHGCGVPEISRKPVQEIDGFPIFGPEQYTTQEYYLQEVDLDSNPEFEALSYTWKDDPIQTTSSWETITCDGREMAITDGLGNALRRLSTIKRDVPIWIDAICINQENTTERSNQVNMMERIYSAARTVVIWLGPTLTPKTWYFSGPQVSIQLMEDLPRLDASSSDNPLDFRRTAGALKGFGVSLVDLIALADFFGRPWFSRVWTIQELLLANEIVVYWGPFEIEWKTLYNTALVVSIFFQYTEVSGVIRRADQKWIDGARMHVLLKRLDQPLSKEPLDYYFDLSRSHAATDPRDKVFALLGLAEPGPGTVPFEADYSLPVEMVYMACASYVMRGRTGLQLLSMVEDKAERKLSGLPSWVPDLTVAARARRLRFHRAPARESQRHEIKGSSLVVEASSCAIVEAVAEGLEEIMDELWPLDLLRMLSSFGPVYATGERTLDVLCQTLAAPVVGPQEVDAELLRKGFDHWLVMQFMLSIAWADGYLQSSGHFLSRFLTGSATARGKNRDSLPGNWSESLRDALHTFGRVFADEIDIEEKIASIKATLKESWGKKDHKEISDKLRKPLNMFDSRFFRSYKGRRLFRTKEGFAGLGPESTKPGDEFFLLANAHVPFVLRSVSSGVYELVGEAYVHGFMKGQAFQEVGRQMNRIEII